MGTRSVRDLSDFALRYDLENDSPFKIPDENTLQPIEPLVVDESMNLVIGFDDKSAAEASGIRCAARRAEPDATHAEDDNPPATNRGMVKYQKGDFPDGWGGYDGGVEASIYGKWDKYLFEKLTPILDAAKKASDDGDGCGCYIDLGGFVWFVRPMGANAGFWKYKWVLESHGIKLYIHSNPCPTTPAVRVRFGFECLARTDLFVAVRTLRKVLESVGFNWDYEILSRVDMQVLLPVNIYDFLHAMEGSRVVTRCRGKLVTHFNLFTSRLETITVSSHNVELCIYDKRAQLFTADSRYFMTFCKYVLGGDQVPEYLTRVEFRIRRDMLKRYGISSFSDLYRSQSALPQLLGTDWFRILKDPKVRGSEKEQALSPLWVRVLEAFRHYFVTGSQGRSKGDLQASKVRVVAPKVERVIKQAMGLLSSAASTFLPRVSDVEDVVLYCRELIDRYGQNLYFKTVEKQIENSVVHAMSEDWDCRSEIDLSLAPFFYS